MSPQAKLAVKIAALGAVAFAVYDTIAVPYGGILSIVVAPVYFAVAVAVIWIIDRAVRRFVRSS